MNCILCAQSMWEPGGDESICFTCKCYHNELNQYKRIVGSDIYYWDEGRAIRHLCNGVMEPEEWIIDCASPHNALSPEWWKRMENLKAFL